MNKWTNDSINDRGTLGNISKMQEIDVSMKYIGGAFKYFSFHVEEDHLASLPHFEEGAGKVWYVCTSQAMN